jgi:hypothetical protein
MQSEPLRPRIILYVYPRPCGEEGAKDRDSSRRSSKPNYPNTGRSSSFMGSHRTPNSSRRESKRAQAPGSRGIVAELYVPSPSGSPPLCRKSRERSREVAVWY